MDDMEDHHHYGNNMSDLRQLINGAGRTPPRFPAAAELFVGGGGGRSLPFEMMMGGRSSADLMPPRMPLHDFVTSDHHSHNAASATTTTTLAGTGTASGGGGLEVDLGGGDGGTGRWPRQETLTLLDIRSRLDPKFKEANHKGPLWDEVSRTMSEEHGYLRSGKKCREKFENLYKYYKKTKEGKAGRQDGKHYRFFRQLEALYGDTTNNINPVSEPHLVFHQQDLKSNLKLSDSLSLSNSSEFDSGSSVDKRRKRRGGRSWKAKIKDFIDAQMRKLMERQEAWLQKMMTTMEQKEQERVLRDEQWRKEEAARMDREQKLWAKEKAWIETRDAALMEILEKIKARDGSKDQTADNAWSEPEITRLIQLRSSLESSSSTTRINNGDGEDLLWEEIGAKMSCYGYERNGSMCKEKWEAINFYLSKRSNKEECNNKKRKEDSASYNFHNYDGNNSLYNQGGYSEIINEQGPPETARMLLPNNNDGSSPSSSNAGNAAQDSCFRFLMGDGDHHHHALWEPYNALNKLNKGENQ